jgi:hypothetical protein
MMSTALLLLAAGLAEAHCTCRLPLTRSHVKPLTPLADTWPNVNNGAAWQYSRITANHYTSAPVPGVNSTDMLCYQLAPGDQGTSTLSVNAGGSITYGSTPAVYHPGPLFAYMAKVCRAC